MLQALLGKLIFRKRKGIAQSGRGVSMAEYTVGGVLIGVFCIGAVTGLAGNVDQLLALLQGNARSHNENADKAVAMQRALDEAAVAKATAVAPHAPSSLLNASLDSLHMDLSSYPMDVQQSIETAGANGTTQMLLATLESYIQQQLASGEINQEQANQITALANQGHTLANLQSLIEQAAAKSGSNRVDFKNTKIPYEGGFITMEDAGYLLDTLDASNKYAVKVSGPDGRKFSVGQENAAFFQALATVNANAGIGQSTKDVINVLAGQIAEISRSVGCTAYKIIFDGSKPVDFVHTMHTTLYEDQMTPGIAESLPSLQMHQKSTAICDAGNGKDNGKKCQ